MVRTTPSNSDFLCEDYGFFEVLDVMLSGIRGGEPRSREK